MQAGGWAGGHTGRESALIMYRILTFYYLIIIILIKYEPVIRPVLLGMMTVSVMILHESEE